MARGPHPRGRGRQEPILDHVLQMSIDGADGIYDDETGAYKEVVLTGLSSADHAMEVRRSLYRSARHMKVALSAKYERGADGGHQLRFTVFNKAHARRYVNSIPAHRRSYNQHVSEISE